MELLESELSIRDTYTHEANGPSVGAGTSVDYWRNGFEPRGASHKFFIILLQTISNQMFLVTSLLLETSPSNNYKYL